MTRSFPLDVSRPAVARNAPPFPPSSSPKTRPRSSRAISRVSASLTASTTVRSATPVPVEALQVAAQPRRCVLVHLSEIERRIRSRLLLRFVPRHPELFFDLILDAIERGAVHDSARDQVPLHAAQRVAVDPELMHLARLVSGWIVGRRMEAEPVRDRLDKRRPLAVASTGNRLTHRPLHGEKVVACP